MFSAGTAGSGGQSNLWTFLFSFQLFLFRRKTTHSRLKRGSVRKSKTVVLSSLTACAQEEGTHSFTHSLSSSFSLPSLSLSLSMSLSLPSLSLSVSRFGSRSPQFETSFFGREDCKVVASSVLKLYTLAETSNVIEHCLGHFTVGFRDI